MRVFLKAANGQYVCAENGGGGVIVVNRNAPNVWEIFDLLPVDAPPLRDGGRACLRSYNGAYVSAESAGNDPLVANRSALGPWETFIVSAPGHSTIESGQRISLKAVNGKYVCAEGGGGRELQASRDAVGPWETFTVESAIVIPQPDPQASRGWQLYFEEVHDALEVRLNDKNGALINWQDRGSAGQYTWLWTDPMLEQRSITQWVGSAETIKLWARVRRLSPGSGDHQCNMETRFDSAKVQRWQFDETEDHEMHIPKAEPGPSSGVWGITLGVIPPSRQGGDGFNFEGALLDPPIGAKINTVTNNALNVNDVVAVPLTLSYTDVNGASVGPVHLLPNGSTTAFRGLSMGGTWKARAEPISKTLLKDFISIDIAWSK